MKALRLISIAACLIACGGSAPPKPAVAPKPTAALAPTKVAASSESLIELIPETAIGAMVVRSAALDVAMRFIQGGPAQQAELGAYLRAKLGADVSRTRGVVAYVLGEGAQPDWVVLLRMDSPGQLLGQSVGRYHDRDVRRIGDDPLIYAATLEQGIAIGTPQGLTAAMDLAAGALPALHAKAPLGMLIDAAPANVTFAAAVALDTLPDTEAAAPMQQFGLRYATFTIDASNRFVLRVNGTDAARLEQARAMIEGGKQQALVLARSAADGANTEADVWKGAATIIGYHQVKALFDELGPRLEGTALVASYAAPADGSMVPMLGIGAALAVPAFIGYVRRSKTAEVTQNFGRIFELLRARQALALEGAGKVEAKRKRVNAALARQNIARTPAQVPCGEEQAWSEADLARFKLLGFAPEGPTYFSYELGTPAAVGTQAQYAPDVVLVLKATGDLDCDQQLSTFELPLSLDASGNLVRAASVYIHEEIE